MLTGQGDPGLMPAYKGFLGSVEYSAADGVLHGRLICIRDLVTYEGVDHEDLEKAFHEAVDDYLALCAAERRKPA